MKKVLLFLLISFAVHALELKDEKGNLTPTSKEFLTLFNIPSDLTIDQLIFYLQLEWMQENRERWEMESKYEEKQKEVFPFLEKLGFINTLHAKEKFYDYALILGAMAKPMRHRLDFLYQEWKKGVRFEKIVLLTGDRDLDPKRENFPAGLKTEKDLFVYLMEHHPLKETVSYIVIDSPKQKLSNEALRRPTTQSTIRDWMTTNPKPGKCLFVSTQPFVGYQEAVAKSILPKKFSIEAIGPKAENSSSNLPYSISIYLDTFAKWLMFEHIREH